MNNCLQTYQLNKAISQLISNANLTVGENYWVLRDIFKEVERLYFAEVEKEIKESQKNDRINELDNV